MYCTCETDLRNFCAAYLAILSRRPILTKAVTGGLL